MKSLMRIEKARKVSQQSSILRYTVFTYLSWRREINVSCMYEYIDISESASFIAIQVHNIVVNIEFNITNKVHRTDTQSSYWDGPDPICPCIDLRIPMQSITICMRTNRILISLLQQKISIISNHSWLYRPLTKRYLYLYILCCDIDNKVLSISVEATF